VITTVRNGAATIERAIQSVLCQTYKNIQYIIIDAKSTDGTVDIIRKYENRIYYWQSEADCGIYDGFNKGILKSTGMYVGILNADDYLSPNAIERVVSNIPVSLKDENLPIIHGNIILTMASGMPIAEYGHKESAIARRFSSMPINHPATFVPLSVYKQIGGFNKEFQIAGDYDFILRAVASGVHFQHVNEVWMTMQVGGASSLRNAYTIALERFKARVQNGGGFFASSFRLALDLAIFSIRKFKRLFVKSKFEAV
jgi:glycosyltransferase involved in cell wall biosynthesis